MTCFNVTLLPWHGLWPCPYHLTTNLYQTDLAVHVLSSEVTYHYSLPVTIIRHRFAMIARESSIHEQLSIERVHVQFRIRTRNTAKYKINWKRIDINMAFSLLVQLEIVFFWTDSWLSDTDCLFDNQSVRRRHTTWSPWRFGALQNRNTRQTTRHEPSMTS